MIGKGWMSSAEWPFLLLDLLRFEILPIKKKLCKFDFAKLCAEEDVEWDMPVGKSDGSQGHRGPLGGHRGPPISVPFRLGGLHSW